MASVTCITSTGTPVEVAEADVTYGPAVYGILIENRRVLLQQHSETRLWHPPGGILRSGETPERGVRAFFRTATGFLPELTALLRMEEQHRVDEQGRAWHLTVFYYGLRRAVGSSVGLAGVAESLRPEWVTVRTLAREAMHFGYEAVQIGARREDGV